MRDHFVLAESSFASFRDMIGSFLKRFSDYHNQFPSVLLKSTKETDVLMKCFKEEEEEEEVKERVITVDRNNDSRANESSGIVKVCCSFSMFRLEAYSRRNPVSMNLLKVVRNTRKPTRPIFFRQSSSSSQTNDDEDKEEEENGNKRTKTSNKFDQLNECSICVDVFGNSTAAAAVTRVPPSPHFHSTNTSNGCSNGGGRGVTCKARFVGTDSMRDLTCAFNLKLSDRLECFVEKSKFVLLNNQTKIMKNKTKSVVDDVEQCFGLKLLKNKMKKNDDDDDVTAEEVNKMERERLKTYATVRVTPSSKSGSVQVNISNDFAPLHSIPIGKPLKLDFDEHLAVKIDRLGIKKANYSLKFEREICENIKIRVNNRAMMETNGNLSNNFRVNLSRMEKQITIALREKRPGFKKNESFPVRSTNVSLRHNSNSKKQWYSLEFTNQFTTSDLTTSASKNTKFSPKLTFANEFPSTKLFLKTSLKSKDVYCTEISRKFENIKNSIECEFLLAYVSKAPSNKDMMIGFYLGSNRDIL